MPLTYRYGPTAALSNRTSWGPVTSPTCDPKTFERPLSGNYDRIFNSLERTNTFEYVKNGFGGREEERHIGHGEIVVNRKLSSTLSRADCSLAAQTPCSDEDEEFYREKILYSQARHLLPLQEDLADWINKTIDITYLTGENFFDVLDNGVELCQLAAIIHERAQEAIEQGLIVGSVPQIRGRCWQRAARRSFFSRDNTENFITFCRELGVHENLLFESDDLVLHNQPRQVILCLLEVSRLAANKYNVEPPGLVQLEKEIALEEQDSGLEMSGGSSWQFRETTPNKQERSIEPPPTPDEDNGTAALTEDRTDAESTKSGGTVDSTDSDVPLRPTNELDKRVQLVSRLMERGCRCAAEGGRCARQLKVKKVGEGRYNIAGRNVFIRLLKGRHMMVRVGGGWDTLEHFLSRHEPCQVRLVTQGRRSSLLPVTLPSVPSHPVSTVPAPGNTIHISPATSTGKISPIEPINPRTLSRSSVASKETPSNNSPATSTGKISPVEAIRPRTLSRSSVASKDASLGTVSPTSSGKISPVADIRRASTPKPARIKSAMTLPLNEPAKTRKQSAPCLSTPNTPRSKMPIPIAETKKSLTTLNAQKKSRSMSLVLNHEHHEPKKLFCGTDRLNQSKARSLATTPTPNLSETPKKTRSQSLATTPVETKKTFCGSERLNTKKTRSMSLASPISFRPLNKSASVSGGITQAAIEESIRLSLAASIADSPNKPFLHIKAKYRSPPPREVPPR